MMMFILTSIAVDLILSSTILLILVSSSTVFVQGWNTNNSNNNQFSLRSSSLFSGTATTVWNRNNRNNSKGIGNVIGINNNNNRNHNKNRNRNRNNSRHRNNNDAAVSSLSLVPLDFVDFSSHFSTALSTKYEATKTALVAQPLLTEAKSALPLVQEAAKKVVVGAAGASTSSDVQAEILTDSSIGLMEYPSFLPDVKTSQLRIKYAQVLGRILIIDISLLPGHSFHPEELAIQLFLLGASMDPIIRSIQLFRAISAVRCTTEGCTIDFDDLVDDDKGNNNIGVGVGIGGGRDVECTFIKNNNENHNNDPDLACLDYNDSNNVGGNENVEEDESSYL